MRLSTRHMRVHPQYLSDSNPQIKGRFYITATMSPASVPRQPSTGAAPQGSALQPHPGYGRWEFQRILRCDVTSRAQILGL